MGHLEKLWSHGQGVLFVQLLRLWKQIIDSLYWVDLQGFFFFFFFSSLLDL